MIPLITVFMHFLYGSVIEKQHEREVTMNNILKFRGKGKLPSIGKVVLVAAIIAVVLLVSNSYYDVNEQEQAVVTMFGKAVDVKTAGLYFKIPLIQKIHKVDTTTHGMQIGYTGQNESGYSNYTTVENEALMITSDFNFVDIDFYLEYRVTDPVKYLYTSKEPIVILKNLTQAAIRSTVIRYTVDDVITTGKSQIQSEVREDLTAGLQEADIGIEVVNLSVQDAEPPTAIVMQAFKAVETAKQGADTAINNANKYKNEQIPAAEAEADRITQAAVAQKEARIAEAEGQAARFSAIYEQYALNPNITKQRLFYEMLEEVLPGRKVIITDGTTETVLPLDSFAQFGTDTGSSQGGE